MWTITRWPICLRQGTVDFARLRIKYFRASSENTFYRVQGAKLEFADHMVDMMNRGNWRQMEIANAAKKLEQEVFQVGNINQAREVGSELAASRYGLLGQSIPHVQPQRELIVQKAAELQGLVDEQLSLAGSAVDAASYKRVLNNMQSGAETVTQHVRPGLQRPLEKAIGESVTPWPGAVMAPGCGGGKERGARPFPGPRQTLQEVVFGRLNRRVRCKNR